MTKKVRMNGFTIEFSKRGDYEYMVAETVAKTWRMVLRSDSEIYWLMRNMWEGDSDGTNVYKEYVHSYVQMCYICASVSPDEQWVKEFVDIYNKYCQRVSDMRGESYEDEGEVLKAEKIKELERKQYEGEQHSDHSEDGAKDSAL